MRFLNRYCSVFPNHEPPIRESSLKSDFLWVRVIELIQFLQSKQRLADLVHGCCDLIEKFLFRCVSLRIFSLTDGIQFLYIDSCLFNILISGFSREFT